MPWGLIRRHGGFSCSQPGQPWRGLDPSRSRGAVARRGSAPHGTGVWFRLSRQHGINDGEGEILPEETDPDPESSGIEQTLSSAGSWIDGRILSSAGFSGDWSLKTDGMMWAESSGAQLARGASTAQTGHGTAAHHRHLLHRWDCRGRRRERAGKKLGFMSHTQL